MSANLGAFAALSAPGSRIALTYIAKSMAAFHAACSSLFLGEPCAQPSAQAEIAQLARSHAWRPTSDTNIEDWLRETPGLKLTRRQVGLQWLESIWVGEIGQ